MVRPRSSTAPRPPRPTRMACRRMTIERVATSPHRFPRRTRIARVTRSVGVRVCVRAMCLRARARNGLACVRNAHVVRVDAARRVRRAARAGGAALRRHGRRGAPRLARRALRGAPLLRADRRRRGRARRRRRGRADCERDRGGEEGRARGRHEVPRHLPAADRRRGRSRRRRDAAGRAALRPRQPRRDARRRRSAQAALRG